MAGEFRSLAQRLSQQNAWVALAVVVGTVMAAGFLLAIGWTFWCAVVVLAAGLLAARKRWPSVRIRHYFTSSKATLPAFLVAGGVGSQWVVDSFLPGASGRIGWLLGGGALAAVSTGAVIAIFEGKLMKSIFDLVPVEQRPGLQTFLKDGDAVPPTGGQYADFSELDQGTVVDAIEQRVIGQDAIVSDVVATAFRRARLRRPNKPVAVFLFVGATGAGKTELAKALATGLFGGENKLIRVDCNELSGESNVARLVGAPPGYIGSNRGSDFCRAIGRVGSGVILFDEIEKAHPVVLKAIMSLLDEARITEQSTSTTYSATGFVIVMTSNAAAAEIAQIAATQDDTTSQRARVKDTLKHAGFLPEVLARIDAIYPFARLSRSAVAEIVGRLLLGNAAGTGVEIVSVDAALLVDLVTQQEKLADYGVREVVRLVESAVVDGLLDAKDRGFTRAAIQVVDDEVQVEGVRS